MNISHFGWTFLLAFILSACSPIEPGGSGYSPYPMMSSAGKIRVFKVESCSSFVSGEVQTGKLLVMKKDLISKNQRLNDDDLFDLQMFFYPLNNSRGSAAPAILLNKPDRVIIRRLSKNLVIQEMFQRKEAMFDPVLLEDLVLEQLFLSEVKQVNFPKMSMGQYMNRGFQGAGITSSIEQYEGLGQKNNPESQVQADTYIGFQAPVFQMIGDGGKLVVQLDVQQRASNSRFQTERLIFVRNLSPFIRNLGDLEMQGQYFLTRTMREMESNITSMLLDCWGLE